MLGKVKNSPKAKTVAAATIYDVARAAGVSKTTVSRVVNDDAAVSPETRELVQNAIRSLRYTPNKAARSLASQAEARIGLLYNNPSVAYFSELLIGALESSSRHGVQLVVDKCEVGNPAAARKAIQSMVSGGINGILLTAPLSESTALIKSLSKSGIAIVAVATGRFRSDVCCVGIDDFVAAHEMTTYLIGLGHRHIGFVKGHPGHTSSKQRYLGFCAALQDAGIDLMPGLVVQGYNSYRSGLTAGDTLLDARPTAIFAGNDDMASGVLSAVHRRGLVVPQDLSVVGFDDTIAGSVWPELTTVRQPISEIGARAIDVLIRDIGITRAGGIVTQENILIPHSLIHRESVSAPKEM